MAALRVVDGLKMLGLTAGIGVATGRVWCGVNISIFIQDGDRHLSISFLIYE